MYILQSDIIVTYTHGYNTIVTVLTDEWQRVDDENIGMWLKLGGGVIRDYYDEDHPPVYDEGKKFKLEHWNDYEVISTAKYI